MGFLENLENSLNDDFQFESGTIPETDSMGREKFWEDLSRPEEPNLAVKLFSENVCNECSCKD